MMVKTSSSIPLPLFWCMYTMPSKMHSLLLKIPRVPHVKKKGKTCISNETCKLINIYLQLKDDLMQTNNRCTCNSKTK